MTKLRTIQILRGTTAQNNAYTGVIGELTMDTEKKQLRIHDGSTVGGKVVGGDGITNQNPASGAVNPIYDWVGTLAEYNAQNIETNHPDWVCFIIDDYSALTYEAYNKAQTDALLNDKADVSALNAVGAHVVTEFQEPQTSGQRLWYRKYADGWVEQGGYISNDSGGATKTITLPVAMKYSNYTLVGGLLNGTVSASYEHMNFNSLTTTGFKFISYDNYGCEWLVCGMAA